tara:strand:+ start:453 stop:608 length:156 start_codon:yes stop_codon:yes gene_type:complete
MMSLLVADALTVTPDFSDVFELSCVAPEVAVTLAEDAVNLFGLVSSDTLTL